MLGNAVGLWVTRRDVDRDVFPSGAGYVPPHHDAADRCLGAESRSGVRLVKLATGAVVSAGLSSCGRAAPAVGAARVATRATAQPRYVVFLFICTLPDGRARRRKRRAPPLDQVTLNVSGMTFVAPW